jgi:acyl-CoA reductase-like NAD-dependent aldehyde dehydrogenase
MDEFSSFVNTVGGNPTSGLQVTQGTNPSTRQKLWDVPVASLEDVERATASARIAFKDWSQSSWSQRQDSLVAARDILVAHRSKLATLLTKEGGKPVTRIHAEAATYNADDQL